MIGPLTLFTASVIAAAINFVVFVWSEPKDLKWMITVHMVCALGYMYAFVWGIIVALGYLA